jgi:tetratricopeptide (TPR) repeat protein/predicted Ser/Thr protein kinase
MSQWPQMLPLIEAVFNEALALPEGDRPGFIEARCGGDAVLKTEVYSLLKACAEEEVFAATRLWEARTNARTSLERKRVGAYEIDRLIGRGGMGAVYAAHRADGNFEKQVAIKLIDLPLATDLFRERFRMERQILAGLNHPLIARLLDGGVTSDGEPFLVMEYVDGVPIHRFCEDHHLSIAERLLLFKSVCEAVQFAHQNLVVHRDLKPDNILVMEDGTPRLLDFGTAKLLSPSADGLGSEFTRMGFQSFTPQYASPEQVLGKPITTASDTYSLGVLLYLLLMGDLPYELKEFTTAEMIAVICEQPVRRPASFAGGGRVDPDLEAIVFKALRKVPEERYLTAAQLAQDVQAFLEGRTVTARRGTFRYRADKFVRRHRIALLGAVLVIASLAAGFGGVLWQARVADRERRVAVARATDLRQLSNSLLSELDEAIKELPGSTGVQRLLVTRVLEHLDRMSKDAGEDRLIQLDLVNAYTRLGNIQGNPYDQNLGDPDGGLVSLDKALAIAKGLVASKPLDSEALRAMASVEQARSEVLWGVGKTPDAVESMRAATAAFDRLVAGDVTPAQLAEAGAAFGALGDELGQPGTPSLGDLAGALAAYRKNLDLDERAIRIDPGFPRARRGLAVVELKIGNVELETDPGQALKDYELAGARFDALPESKQENLSSLRMRANVDRKKAQALREMGEYPQAIPLFEEALAIQKQISAADPKDSRSLFDVYVDLTQEANDYEDAADPALEADRQKRLRNLALAEPLLREAESIALQLVKQNSANDDWKASLADVQVRLGNVEAELKPSDDAEKLSATGLATLKEVGAKHPNSVWMLDFEVAALLTVKPTDLRDPKLAIACAEREALLTMRRQPGVLLFLAQAYHSGGQIQGAHATANEGLALLPPVTAGAPMPRTRRLLEIETEAR